jgi:ribonuclease HI
MSKSKKKYYAVVRGRIPGIYEEWYGENGAAAQIDGFPDARFKGFSSYTAAKECFERGEEGDENPSESILQRERESPGEKQVIIYTDGGSLNNPGPGGYGAVLMYKGHRKEISGGFRRTTNNRMELTACIAGLEKLKYRCSVSLYSDSSYVVNGISKGWARRWRERGWMRNKTDPAENADLWEQLLDLCDRHDVEFIWVKGHAGNPENERCDQLAKAAASQSGLPPDTVYENMKRDA